MILDFYNCTIELFFFHHTHMQSNSWLCILSNCSMKDETVSSRLVIKSLEYIHLHMIYHVFYTARLNSPASLGVGNMFSKRKSTRTETDHKCCTCRNVSCPVHNIHFQDSCGSLYDKNQPEIQLLIAPINLWCLKLTFLAIIG